METWLPVVGYESQYAVSSLGTVRNIKRNRNLAAVDIRGYRRVSLCLNGVITGETIHKIVCLAFLGPRPENHDINHKNGIRHDNRIENLEYCSRLENILHARDSLGRYIGEKHAQAKLTNEDVLEIKRLCRSGFNHSQVARFCGVTPTHISCIVRNKARLRG